MNFLHSLNSTRDIDLFKTMKTRDGCHGNHIKQNCTTFDAYIRANHKVDKITYKIRYDVSFALSGALNLYQSPRGRSPIVKRRHFDFV